MREATLKAIWTMLTLMAAGVTPAQTIRYEYDLAGRLITADYLGGPTIRYSYDPAGNLLQRSVTDSEYVDTNTRWIAHITRAGGLFSTQLIFSNFGGSRAEVRLQPYDLAGQPLPPVGVAVDAQGFLVRDTRDVFGSTNVSHFSIAGSRNLLVTAGYRQASGSGATAHVNETSHSADQFFILPGEWDYVFDGLALVNRSPFSADIELSQLTMTGDQTTQIGKRRFSVPAYAKSLIVLGDGFEPLDDAIFRISCSQQVTLLFLRGSYPGTDPGYLYQTEAIPERATTADRFIPHVTPSSSPFRTRLHFTNLETCTASRRRREDHH